MNFWYILLSEVVHRSFLHALTLSIFLTSIASTKLKTTSYINIKMANIYASKLIPTTRALIGTIIDIIPYILELYNHAYGKRCAPNIIAITITILSGTAEYTHIAISK